MDHCWIYGAYFRSHEGIFEDAVSGSPALTCSPGAKVHALYHIHLLSYPLQARGVNGYGEHLIIPTHTAFFGVSRIWCRESSS